MNSELNTYNQVATLQSNSLSTALSVASSAMIVIAIGYAVVFSITGAHRDYILGAMIAVALLWLLRSLNNRRKPCCHRCRHALSYITRPMLLTQQRLAVKGTLQGNYFYTRCRWGALPINKRWAKISNRANACHHCRLIELHSHEYFELPTAQELARCEDA